MSQGVGELITSSRGGLSVVGWTLWMSACAAYKLSNFERPEAVLASRVNWFATPYI